MLFLLRPRGECSGSVFSSLSWGSEVMALTSKLCAGLRGYAYVLEAEDFAETERDGRELAKRAVLEVLDCSRIVEVAVYAEIAAGVEWIGSISAPLSLECWFESESDAAESSKAGKDGREGGSPSSTAWILRHIRDGVSSIAILRRYRIRFIFSESSNARDHDLPRLMQTLMFCWKWLMIVVEDHLTAFHHHVLKR
jgi:hypothetical protein